EGILDLNWKVENEKDVVYYEVERSRNGKDFEKQSLLENSGNETHSWSDNKPLEQAWYRIKASLVSGKSIYSQTLQHKKSPSAIKVSVFPNPVKSQEVSLRISGAEAGTYTVILSDISGKRLAERILELGGGEWADTWNPGVLRSGIYQVLIYNPEGGLIAQQ